MLIDLKVAQLLSSKLCHDLVGPAGAVHNGMELLQEMGSGDDGGATALVASSIDKMSARLGFYRMAFGLGGLSGRSSAFHESRDLAEGFLAGGRVSLVWPETFGDGTRDLPVYAAKLLLNMVLVGADAMPRGGAMQVSLALMGDGNGRKGVGMAVDASGEGVGFKEEMRAALSSGRSGNQPASASELGLNAHNVHGYFCQRLAASLGCEVEVSESMNDFKLAVLVPEQNEG